MKTAIMMLLMVALTATAGDWSTHRRDSNGDRVVHKLGTGNTPTFADMVEARKRAKMTAEQKQAADEAKANDKAATLLRLEQDKAQAYKAYREAQTAYNDACRFLEDYRRKLLEEALQ